MNDQEKELVKKLGHELIDMFLPEFLAAEEARVPEPYGSVVKMVLEVMTPKMQAFLDAKVEGMGA